MIQPHCLMPYCMSLLVAGLAPAQPAAAQVQPEAAAAPLPAAQPGTPPSERTPERAPANPATRTYPRQADGHGIKLSGYNPSRWAEDWRAMRDLQKRNDMLDRLKYLPLGLGSEGYVTLSGEARLRTTFVSNPGLVASPYRREDLLRLVGGADVHIGPIRAYGELAHGEIGGVNYGVPAAKSRNTLVLQQAFGEVSGPVGPAVLGIRYGRQGFTDGPPALIAIRDDNTILFVEQGVRAWAQLSSYRVDAFDFHHAALGSGGTSDDIADKTTRFSGITAGMVLADNKTNKMFLDPFVWRDRNDKIRWGSTTAREVRNHYGVRLWGSLDRVTIDWTIDRQNGDFDGRRIDAWAAFIAQTYQLSRTGLMPKIGLHLDYGSGGGTFGTGTIRTARYVTGGAIPYSYQGAFTPTNLLQISPNLTISPAKAIDITGEYQRSYRVDAADALYKGSGAAYAGSQLLPGNHVGDAARLQGSWKITPRVSLITRYEYFRPAGALEKANVVSSHYLSSWISFRF